MARIGPMNINVGNNKYQFVVYDLNGPAYNVPGVYIFSKGRPNAQGGNTHQILYIGESETLKDRVTPNHEKWDDAIRQGMNFVSIYVPYSAETRQGIEKELIQHFKPPLNDLIV